MSDFLSEFSGIAPAVLESLINATVVGFAFTLAVLLTLRRMNSLSAATRHGIWWIALGVVITLPVVGALTNSGGAIPRGTITECEPPPVAPAVVHVRPIARHTRVQVPIAPEVGVTTRRAGVKTETTRTQQVELTPMTSNNTPAVATLTSANETNVESRAGLQETVSSLFTAVAEETREVLAEMRWSPYVITVGEIAAVVVVMMFGFAALMLLRLLRGCRRLLALRRRAVPLPEALESRLLSRLPSQRRMRQVQIRQVKGLAVPTVLGIVRPVILFPSELLNSLTDSDFENIVLHEYAHVRRWDDWTNLLQRIITAVFFFHPGVRIIGRQLCLEREIACDDWVIAQTGRTRAYATCLTKLVSLTPWTRRFIPAPSVLKTKSQFARRIETLLNRRRNASPQTSGLAFFAAAVICSVLLVQMAKVPPVVAVFDPVESILRGDAPIIATRMLPRPGPPRAPVAVAPVVRADVVYDCDVAFPGCATPSPDVAVQPANVVTYVPVGDDREWSVSNWQTGGEQDWDSKASFADYFGSYFSDLFKSNRTDKIAYNIQYRNGQTDHVTLSQLLSLLAMGIDGDFVREVRQAGLENVTIDDLVALRQNGVDGDYIEELSGAGLRYLTVHDVIRLRQNGISADDVEGFSKSDGDDLSVDDIIRLHTHGVTGDFASAIHDAVQSSLSVTDIAALRAHGVDPEYIQGLRDARVALSDIGDVISLRDNGVDPELAASAMAYSSTELNVHDLISLRSNGVSSEYLENLRDAGVNDLDADDLVRLRTNGIDPEYVAAVQKYDPNDVSPADIISLRTHGVDQDYLEELETVGLGARELSTRDLVNLRVNGVSPGFASAARSRWGSDVSVNEMILLRVNGVTVDYLEDLDDIDRSSFSPRDVVLLRTNGVSAEYIVAVQAYDFGETVDVDDIIALRTNGISAAYLEEFGDIDRPFSVHDLITLRSNGVDAEFVKELEGLEIDDLSVGDIIQMRVLGVSPRTIDEFRNDRSRSY